LAANYPASADCAAFGTRTIYGSLGRAIRTERYSGVVLQLSDDAAYPGQKIVTLPTGFAWATSATKLSQEQTSYDDLGRVQYKLDAFGSRTEYMYNATGQEIESRYQVKDDKDGKAENGNLQWVATRTVYDALGRAIITSDPFVVQADGTMPASFGTYTTYDTQGRVVKTERLAGLVITITDPAQTPEWRATSVVWSTETVYNRLGQVIRSVGQHAPDTAGPATDYEYDAQGRQIAQIGPVVTDERTGELVRLRSETHYDAQGHVAYTTTNIRVVVDSQGVVQSTSYSALQETHYQYDADGHTVRTTYADGSFVTQTYDALGRLWKQSYQTAVGATPLEKIFEYDEFGRLIKVTLPAVVVPATGQTVAPCSCTRTTPRAIRR
jgi:YD repeat-containing protein